METGFSDFDNRKIQFFIRLRYPHQPLSRVEEGRGRSLPAAPFPFPAHRTGRADFPHPALRLASPQGLRLGLKMHASETDDTEVSIDDFSREDPGRPGLHLVPLAKEVAHAVVDVMVNRPICL